MREIFAVIIISYTVSTLPLQIVGFFTPYWACGKVSRITRDDSDNYRYYYRTTTTTELSPTNMTNNGSCNLDGLFYTCAENGCYASVLDNTLLGLCLTSLIVTCGTAGYMIKIFRDQMNIDSLVNWTLELNAETVILVLFLTGQLLAGIAVLLIFINYQVMGWSAIIFTTLAIPIFTIITIILSIILAIIICVCVAWCGDKYKSK